VLARRWPWGPAHHLFRSHRMQCVLTAAKQIDFLRLGLLGYWNMYRKQWKETTFKEGRFAKVAKWFGKRWPTAVGILCLVGVPLALVYAVERGIERRVAREKALCAPLFYGGQKRIAHNLLKITCLDKNGKAYHRHIQDEDKRR
jgi:hypothetical protein